MSSKSLRSLMKDRQLAKRIQHQFAKYDSIGRLTCSICNGMTVKSEALWPSHLNSKPHRVNYQRVQSSLKAQSESNQANTNKASTTTKRKSSDTYNDENTQEKNNLKDKKIRFNEPSSNENDDDMGEEEASKNKTSSSLPANFFDDPSEAPRPLKEALDDDIQDDNADPDDPEWSAFQAALQQPIPQSTFEDTPANVFAQASVIAEPVLYQSELSNNNQSNPIQDPQLEEEQQQQQEEEEEEEEEDPIEKKIREEKEEIMDRIQNEEREQLEADQRVLRMKARVEAFRAKRKKTTTS